jgi:2-polyprenyl-3-methyl-5-hydroxy-6-metoxy-1,4-benzoquinol methylase
MSLREATLAEDQHTSFDSAEGQRGLEDHYEQWFAQIESDFRATTLNQLVLALTPAGRVLDMGCGSGALSAELQKAGRDVVSQDLSDRMVAMCRTHLSKQGCDADKVRLGGVDAIPESQHFDAVIALDVIEHIEDDVDAVKRMREALKPGGTLVLSVPALSALYGPKDTEVGHFRRYDKPDLLSVIDHAGLEVQRCRYWNLLGVAPVWLSNKRGKRLDESLRYSKSAPKRMLNRALRFWFEYLENPLSPPLGMTLLLTATPR